MQRTNPGEDDEREWRRLRRTNWMLLLVFVLLLLGCGVGLIASMHFP